MENWFDLDEEKYLTIQQNRDDFHIEMTKKRKSIEDFPESSIDTVICSAQNR